MVRSSINFGVKWGGLVAGELQTRLLTQRGGGGPGGTRVRVRSADIKTRMESDKIMIMAPAYVCRLEN